MPLFLTPEKEEEGQRKTLVKHKKKPRNSEKRCPGQPGRKIGLKRITGTMEKIQMLWQNIREKAIKKGHRQVTGAGETGADVSSEEVTVAEAEVLLKPTLLHSCKLNQEPQLPLLSPYKTKSTFNLF